MDDYVRQVEAMRRAKDEAFRTDPRSPVPRHARPTFKGLRHYPPDPAWRFAARLLRHEKPREVVMQASDGAAKHYLNVGHFDLPLAGSKVALQAYLRADLSGHGHAEPLFIPFRDKTSGKETYGAGRYLEADPLDPRGDEYVVDFNLAYNPFCAYDDAYSCPFPPPENWLQVPVTAGERTPED